MSPTILNGDAIETLRTLPEASVHCCVTSPQLNTNAVECVGDIAKTLHLNADRLRSECCADVPASFCNASLLAPLLDGTQSQTVAGLICLDTEEWKDCAQKRDCFQISDLPSMESLSAFRAWLYSESITTKDGMQKVDRCGFNLLNAYALGKRRLGGISNNTNVVTAFLDPDSSVCVNNARAISQVEFIHADKSSLEVEM